MYIYICVVVVIIIITTIIIITIIIIIHNYIYIRLSSLHPHFPFQKNHILRRQVQFVGLRFGWRHLRRVGHGSGRRRLRGEPNSWWFNDEKKRKQP
jgi:uncharacterized RDD family membrane protein YckC